MALFDSVWDDLKHAFRTGTMVTRLVILNFIVFVAVNLAFVLVRIYTGLGGSSATDWYNTGLFAFCMPGDWRELLWHPWAIFTSIFLHEAFFHFLNNIIALYLFGTVIGDLIGDRRVLPIYLLGGVFGNVMYFISAHFFSFVGTHALGASGAIMALAGTALIIAPDFRVMLFLLGEVRLKYIVLVMVLLDMVGIASQLNTGGHAAHLGGFAMGCFFAYRLRDGKDLSVPVNNFLARLSEWLPGPRRRKPMTARRRKEPAFRTTMGGARPESRAEAHDLSFQERLDAILDKIKASGYENLTQEEKDFLYDASKRR